MSYDFKKYVLCTSTGVIRDVLLRETACYYIDERGDKFKKCLGIDGSLAFQRQKKDSYRTSTYYIYAEDSCQVAKWREKSRKENLIRIVRADVHKIADRIETYEQALEVGRKLGMKI